MTNILLGLGVLILVIGVRIAWVIVRSRRRTQALREVAAQIGFSFTEEVPPLVRSLEQATLFFKKGAKPRVEHAMEGTVSGMQTLLFDYHFDKESGEDTITSNWTVAAFSSPRHCLPAFALERKRLISLVEDRIEVLGDPEFGKRFRLGGKDKAAVSSVVGPQLIHFLLSTSERDKDKDKWIVEGGGSFLLFHYAKRLPPQKWNGFLHDASQFAAGFFQNAAQPAAGRAASAG